ncbi:hypothetical protein OG21DRAFT_1485384 [Imleria badia]|nr:hypothetical protein OG21DRAFT_1485384 [Imleria badia]
MSTTTNRYDDHIILQKGKPSPLPARRNSTPLSMAGGIFNGSAIQVITAVHAIKSDVFTIYTKHSPQDASNFSPSTKQVLNVADHAESIARLNELLRDLPTQFPRAGAEDLYGRNASIMKVTSPGAYMDFFRDQWEIPRPTEEQKVKFDEAMAIMEKWVAQ